LWKKHGSSLDQGHCFVLTPLGGIGPSFSAGELVGVTLAHVPDTVLMNSRDFCSAVRFNMYAKSALREA
jgi:hypothetical protein